MALKIDEYIWKVKYYLMTKYGSRAADRMVYPLAWYINTGRSSAEFDKRLLTIKPYVIGRLLSRSDSMSYDDMTRLLVKKVNSIA